MKLIVNGVARELDVDPRTPLLYALRDVLGLKSVRYGCGLEQCGACKVLVDGAPRYTCREPLERFDGAEITTVEGFADGDTLAPVQRALLDRNAAQCGYCLSGILVSARALFDADPHPSPEDIRAALNDHLCRCGAHPRILKALSELASRG